MARPCRKGAGVIRGQRFVIAYYSGATNVTSAVVAGTGRAGRRTERADQSREVVRDGNRGSSRKLAQIAVAHVPDTSHDARNLEQGAATNEETPLMTCQRRATAALLAMLALTLTACGSGDGGGAGEVTSTTGAPAATTTTSPEDAVADVNGEWTMTLTAIGTDPPDLELPPEVATKDRALTLSLGDCPAPGDLTLDGDPGLGEIEGAAGSASGDCVGSADVASSSVVFENVPLHATENGFELALQVTALCLDQETGAAIPDSISGAELVYAFAAVTDRDEVGFLEGTVVETTPAASTCPSGTGADRIDYEMTAVPT